MVEKRKEKEDVQRKSVEDVVDYINLSLINIMSCDSFNAVNRGEWWIKKLTKEQQDYYKTYMKEPLFIENAPKMKIIGECLHTKDFGQAISELDKNSDEYKLGIKYALDTIEELNKNGIYHGDILGGHDTDKPDIQDGNIVYKDGEYKLIDFGPKTEKLELDGKVDEKKLNDERIPKPAITYEQEDPVGWEQFLWERYKNSGGLRAEAKKSRKVRRTFRKLSPSSSSESSDDEGFPFPHKIDRKIDFGGIGGIGGKKKRRRTKKKRRHKRKYTRRKKKRKRRRTKKKRRRRR